MTVKFIAMWIAVVGVACSTHAPAPKECAPDLAGGRVALDLLVKTAQVLEPNRRVVHLAHVCSVMLNGAAYPVVDLQELVKGATTPRGVNAILVLGPDGKLRRRIEYTTERPLFCAGAKLHVWGDLVVEGIKSEGNALELSDDGRGLAVEHIEANDLPL